MFGHREREKRQEKRYVGRRRPSQSDLLDHGLCRTSLCACIRNTQAAAGIALNVATTSADMHTDDESLVLILVLHNDGLTLRQGRVPIGGMRTIGSYSATAWHMA